MLPGLCRGLVLPLPGPVADLRPHFLDPVADLSASFLSFVVDLSASFLSFVVDLSASLGWRFVCIPKHSLISHDTLLLHT